MSKLLLCVATLTPFMPITSNMHAMGQPTLKLTPPLITAAAQDNLQGARDLLAAGAGVNERNPQTLTPLMATILHNTIKNPQARVEATASNILTMRTQMIDLLVEHGADVNAQDRDGDTPLMLAVMTAEPHIVKHLLMQGARTDLYNNQGQTALTLRGNYAGTGAPAKITAQEQALSKTKDQEIHDLIQNYHAKRAQEIEAATPLPGPVARLVQSYLTGEETKTQASTEECKPQAARPT